MFMREPLVNSAAAFLVHPNVATVPVADRDTYLKNQGLTPEEIAEAYKRVVASNGAGHSVGTTAPAPAPAPSGSGGEPSFLASLMQWVVSAAVGAGLYHTLALPSGPQSKDEATVAAAAEAAAKLEDADAVVRCALYLRSHCLSRVQ